MSNQLWYLQNKTGATYASCYNIQTVTVCSCYCPVTGKNQGEDVFPAQRAKHSDTLRKQTATYVPFVGLSRLIKINITSLLSCTGKQNSQLFSMFRTLTKHLCCAQGLWLYQGWDVGHTSFPCWNIGDTYCW